VLCANKRRGRARAATHQLHAIVLRGDLRLEHAEVALEALDDLRRAVIDGTE